MCVCSDSAPKPKLQKNSVKMCVFVLLSLILLLKDDPDTANIKVTIQGGLEWRPCRCEVDLQDNLCSTGSRCCFNSGCRQRLDSQQRQICRTDRTERAGLILALAIRDNVSASLGPFLWWFLDSYSGSEPVG